MGWCFQVEHLSPLSGLEYLKVLNVRGFEGLTDLSPLSDLGQLELLDAIYCSRLMDLSPLSGLVQLKKLSVGAHGSNPLTDFGYADQIEQRVKDAQARVNHLTQSILAKAFRGELTTDWRAQNPDLISGDNSAAALLARIRAEREAAASKPKTRRKKA